VLESPPPRKFCFGILSGFVISSTPILLLGDCRHLRLKSGLLRPARSCSTTCMSLRISAATSPSETTLASRTFAPWIETLKGRDYHFHLIYLYLPTADLAVQRVRDRVGGGGHHVPEDTVRRRYRRGLHNFFALYRPIADYWQFFDNSAPQRPRPIAEGRGTMGMVHDQSFWALAQKEASQ
jgi:predicted ABC-type ATPase